MSPFDSISGRLTEIARQVGELELCALKELPSVPWTFVALKSHLEIVAGMIGKQQLLKALNEHLDFSVSLPASVLGRKSSPRKRAAALAAGKLGAKVASPEKKKASRRNLELARAAKARKVSLFRGAMPLAQQIALIEVDKLRKERRAMKFQLLKENRKFLRSADNALLRRQMEEDIEWMGREITKLIPKHRPLGWKPWSETHGSGRPGELLG